MEIQLQELIEQIKKDGVEAAASEAESIIADAKARAEKIVSDAKAQADKILLDAKNENERLVKSSEDAIRQAGRNLLISFRESVTRELKVILNDNVNAVFSSEKFSQIIVDAVKSWAEKPNSDNLSVILNSKDLKSIEENLLAALKDKMIKGITLKPNDNFDGGFRIALENGTAYYDYSSEAVVELLANYLSPKVTALLKEA